MRISALLATLLALAALPALASPAAPAADLPIGKLPETARPIAYRLALDVDPARADFSGSTEIDIETTVRTDRLFIHGNGLKVSRADAVTAGGVAGGSAVPARYEQLNPTGLAVLRFERPLAAGRHTLRLAYTAPFTSSPMGLYKVEVAGRPYVWTQMEPIDARRMFPGFDEPRFKTSYDVTITAPAGMKAFANGADAGQDNLADGQVRHRFAQIGPMPTYLVAIAVGDFDVVSATLPANAVRKQPVAFRGIATKGQAKRLAITMAETPKILELLEAWFGIGYPWPKLDFIASPIHGGAMENTGLIVYDDTLILLDQEAPPSQLRNMGGVVAHELAHQWFGNAVTPVWWEDLWLNESFAEWMGNEVAARWRPDLGVGSSQIADVLDAMDDDSRAIGRPIRQPITDSADANGAFDSITYQKGGQVLRMINGYLGPDRFQAGVRLHLKRHWNGNATSDDFFRNIADGSEDPDIALVFKSFTDQRGVPLVRFGGPDGANFTLAQQRFVPLGVSGAEPLEWLVPVCASSGEGRECTLLAAANGLMPPVSGTAPWVAGNADGAGYYRYDMPAAYWDRLLQAGAELPAPEALTAADSIWAGFTSGNGGFDRVLGGARAFARHADRLAATFLPGKLVEHVERAGTPADRAATAGFIRKLTEPRLAELGLDPKRGAYTNESLDRRQLRQILAAYAVVDGMAPAPSATLAAAGRAALAGDAAALDPAYRVTALRAALRADPRLADPLFAALASSDDPLFRRHAAAALGAEGGTAILDRTADKRLQNLEVQIMLAMQLGQADTRTAALAWTQANMAALKPRLGGTLGNFVGVFNGFCTEADARAVEALLRPQLADLGASPIDLDRMVAGIRQCAAMKTARGADVSAALAAATR